MRTRSRDRERLRLFVTLVVTVAAQRDRRPPVTLSQALAGVATASIGDELKLIERGVSQFSVRDGNLLAKPSRSLDR